MTTVVAALNRIARECSLEPPSNWITTTDVTDEEIRDDFLLETIEDLQRRVDWSAPLFKTTTLAGDGSESYSLPANFARLALTGGSLFETQSVRRDVTPVTSESDWTYLKDFGTGAGNRYFRLDGYDGNFSVRLYPALATGESVTVHYLSNVWMKSSGGTEGSEFTAIDDILLFPRRLVETGTVYRWRKRKGLDYQSTQADHEAMLAQFANRANVKRKVGFGPVSRPSPWDIPVPDFIPSS